MRDGINLYVLEYASGARAAGVGRRLGGPGARRGRARRSSVRWRFEGTEGMALGEIGWPGWPRHVPSTIDYTSIHDDGSWHRPRWAESWFPDAFAGTMGGLLRALETGAGTGHLRPGQPEDDRSVRSRSGRRRDHRVVPLDEFTG